MSIEQDNKAIVGRWFTSFWGKTCDLASSMNRLTRHASGITRCTSRGVSRRHQGLHDGLPQGVPRSQLLGVAT